LKRTYGSERIPRSDFLGSLLDRKGGSREFWNDVFDLIDTDKNDILDFNVNFNFLFFKKKNKTEIQKYRNTENTENTEKYRNETNFKF